MRPNDLVKDSEHSHQVALFAWLAVARLHGFAAADDWAAGATLPIPAPQTPLGPVGLEWAHAIHNQGHGDALRGARARAEGVRCGIPDIFIPVPMGRFHGLYIELKKPSVKPKRDASNGGLSEEQRQFRNYCVFVSYGWEVCYGWREAAEAIRRYFSQFSW